MSNSGNPRNNPRSIQWGNPKSLPAYGHLRLQHGSHLPLETLTDRARNVGIAQGQFYDDVTIVDAERKTPKPRAVYIVPHSSGIGRVIDPDGIATENVTKVLVVRKGDGTIRTSYPITDQHAEDLIDRGKATFIQTQCPMSNHVPYLEKTNGKEDF